MKVHELLKEFDWYLPHLAWINYSRRVGVSYNPPKDDPLQGVEPKRADLSGQSLVDVDLRGADLTDAVCRGTRFHDSSLHGVIFRGADLRDSSFVGTDVTYAQFTGANLTNADFSGACLRGADFSGALLTGVKGFPEVPVVPNIDAAILQAIEQDENSLDMSEWHTCETTHCRAGWAITLAGDVGRELEKAVGSSLAGALIYNASRPGVPVPSWYYTDEDALEDIKYYANK